MLGYLDDPILEAELATAIPFQQVTLEIVFAAGIALFGNALRRCTLREAMRRSGRRALHQYQAMLDSCVGDSIIVLPGGIAEINTELEAGARLGALLLAVGAPKTFDTVPLRVRCSALGLDNWTPFKDMDDVADYGRAITDRTVSIQFHNTSDVPLKIELRWHTHPADTMSAHDDSEAPESQAQDAL